MTLDLTLDLTPAPASAPRARRIASHARTEASLLLRNGEQLLLALAIPVGLLVGGLWFGERVGLEPRSFAASVLALALWSTTFTSLAITTGFERRYGVLERLAATPLSRGDLIAGKALATASIAAAQLLVLAAVALALGWRPAPAPLPTVALALTLPAAVTTFASWALALAGRLRAEATLALANLVYLLVAAGGALVLPLDAYPDAVRPLLAALPSAALGEAWRAWASGTLIWWPVPVTWAWAAVSLYVARKAFRWTS